MKRIKVITYNHAHNYGSVLQSYALQEYIKKIAQQNGELIDYEIIDLYSEYQENLYSVLEKCTSIKKVCRNVVAFFYLKKLIKKHRKFELFIKKRLNITSRYTSEIELKNDDLMADYYISGSDQIWNVRNKDFSDAYFLNFVLRGKKISYACSFGPLEIEWDKYDINKYNKYLTQYTGISVRDNVSAKNVERIADRLATINVDPTLLLEKSEWEEIENSEHKVDKPYILLYCLEPSEQQIRITNLIAKKLQLPIVILRYNNKNDFFNKYIKYYDSGPEEFLSFVHNATLVISSSFHGTIFSMIYHKKFYVLDGLKDNRISTILQAVGLEGRSISSEEDIEKVNLDYLDFKEFDDWLKNELKRSEKYLSEMLDLV